MQEKRQRLSKNQRTILIAGLAVLAVVLGGSSALPTAGKLDRALDRIGWPEGTKEIDTERNGNAMCFDECTTLSRTYRLPKEANDSIVQMVLVGAGYHLLKSEDYDQNKAYSEKYDLWWSLEGRDVYITIGYRVR